MLEDMGLTRTALVTASMPVCPKGNPDKCYWVLYIEEKPKIKFSNMKSPFLTRLIGNIKCLNTALTK